MKLVSTTSLEKKKKRKGLILIEQLVILARLWVPDLVQVRGL